MKSELIAQLALAAILVGLPRADATTIDPQTWEQLVNGADLVGIVECDTAGGIVAGYTVVESWKGPPAGTVLRLAVAADYWEPQFPIALCGERYVVTAFQAAAPSRIQSTTSHGAVPLWWRQIPADFRLPSFQGRAKLPLAQGTNALYALGSPHPDLESFRIAVQGFLALNPEERELRIWRRLSEKYLFERREEGTSEIAARLTSFKQQMAAWTTPAQYVSNLMVLARQQTTAGYSPVWEMLRQGCTTNTLGVLETIAGHEAVPQHVMQAIRYRLAPLARPLTSEPRINETPPSASVLAEARRTLQSSGYSDPKFGKAFDILTRHDPAAAAKFLVKWHNEGKNWTDKNAAYELGSYFAWACGKDRERHLRSLLDASEPYVRVAGAVYGTFEDEAWGQSELKRLQHLDGDPGVWAALNLARHGDKAALSRALKVFATRGEYGMVGVPHRNLQKRLMVLLSNSAKASGLPQPMPPPVHEEKEESFQELHKFYVGWWDLNRGRLIVRDPWLGMPASQKVD